MRGAKLGPALQVRVRIPIPDPGRVVHSSAGTCQTESWAQGRFPMCQINLLGESQLNNEVKPRRFFYFS